MEVNPQLIPASLYRMPAYKHPSSGKIICFFRSDKYFTFGLTEDAQFPQTSKLHVSSWFIEEMNDEIEQKLKEILELLSVNERTEKVLFLIIHSMNIRYLYA